MVTKLKQIKLLILGRESRDLNMFLTAGEGPWKTENRLHSLEVR